MGNKKNLLHLTKIDFLLDLSEALDGMSELRDCHPSEVAIKGIYELIKKVPTIKGIIMVECNWTSCEVNFQTKLNKVVG